MESYKEVPTYQSNTKSKNFGIFTIKEGKYEVPLLSTKCSIEGFITESFAQISFCQTFKNQESEPVECYSKLPTTHDIIMRKVLIEIEDKCFCPIILSADQAKQTYESLIKQGKDTRIVETPLESTTKLELGFLQADQEVKITLVFIQTLNMITDSFYFQLPPAMVNQLDAIHSSQGFCKCSFSFQISTLSKIIFISLPELITIECRQENLVAGIVVSNHANQIARIDFYFRTMCMSQPILYKQESDQYPGYVALAASFHPSLTHEPSEKLQISYGKPPLPLSTPNERSKDFYIFLVDRSGSIKASNMKALKEILKVFAEVLPQDSRFEIISFGETFIQESQNPTGFEYSQVNIEHFQEYIANLKADLGVTDIYSPLKHALANLDAVGYRKTIFLLTDGQVHNRDHVIELASQKESLNKTRIHTIGIGKDYDSQLLEGVAKAGEGVCSIIRNTKDIRAQILQTFQKAKNLLLSNLTLEWINADASQCYPKSKEEFGVLARDERIYAFAYIAQNKLTTAKLAFSAKQPLTDLQSICNLNYGAEFHPLPSGETLFQLCGQKLISELTKCRENPLSTALLYNLLIPGTALITEIKEQRLENYDQEFIIFKREQSVVEPQKLAVNQVGRGGGLFARLFGARRAPPPPRPTPQEAILKIETQVELIEKRTHFLEEQSKKLKGESLISFKQNERQKAKASLKQAKFKEKQIEQLDQQRILLQQQRIMLQNMIVDDIMQAMPQSTIDLNPSSNHREDLSDIQEPPELSDVFSFYQEQDEEDDLLEELEQLEEQAQIEENMKEFSTVVIPQKLLIKDKETRIEQDEDEVKLLEKMMD